GGEVPIPAVVTDRPLLSWHAAGGTRQRNGRGLEQAAQPPTKPVGWLGAVSRRGRARGVTLQSGHAEWATGPWWSDH
ncbi:MAG: hypothetical protein ACRDTT_16160, partial [Pseudonocardiaceae bacterium]